MYATCLACMRASWTSSNQSWLKRSLFLRHVSHSLNVGSTPSVQGALGNAFRRYFLWCRLTVVLVRAILDHAAELEVFAHPFLELRSACDIVPSVQQTALR